MFCIHCGYQLPDDSAFCTGCGKPTEKINFNDNAETSFMVLHGRKPGPASWISKLLLKPFLQEFFYGLIVFIIGLLFYPLAYLLGIIFQILIVVNFISDLVQLIREASRDYDLELNNNILTCSIINGNPQIPAANVYKTKYSWREYKVWYFYNGKNLHFSFNPKTKSEIIEFDALLRKQGNIGGKLEE